MLFIEALDLGLTLPTTTGIPPTIRPFDHKDTIVVTTDQGSSQIQFQWENASNTTIFKPLNRKHNLPGTQRRKRQMQHCPTDTYKICENLHGKLQ